MPSKRERYRSKLDGLMADGADLESFLLRHSGLPGRRADLELAGALADRLAKSPPDEAIWDLLCRWTALDAVQAPTNSKREYLPFCAAQALGACHHRAAPERRRRIVACLQAAARDPRWRMREAACFGFQRIGEDDPSQLVRMFRDRLAGATLLDRRAMLVSLAHPPLLEPEGDAVELALELSDQGLRELSALDPEQLKSEEIRVFRKCLDFVPSVVAAADPERGFAWLRRWAGHEGLLYKKVVVANLRKARLAKHHPDECEGVVAVLSWGE
jgi:hypothetical protein